MNIEDESILFWTSFPKEDLAVRTAALHRQRRELMAAQLPREVEVARRTVGELFLHGAGIEVGAGSRPFPLPPGATCIYGDVRDDAALAKLFKTSSVINNQSIDARTLSGLQDDHFDFAISAHVIEHLEDPIGSIHHTIRVLKPGGIYILVVPDMRYTFDKHREPTSIDHLTMDALDGGRSTRLLSYIDHVTYTTRKEWGFVIADEDVPSEAERLSDQNFDIHFHCWTRDGFRDFLAAISASHGFEVLADTAAVNETAFILRKLEPMHDAKKRSSVTSRALAYWRR